jgi:hypothetical protein
MAGHPISEDEAKQKGVTTRHQRMPNGEARYRLVSGNGPSYILTVASDVGSWQNSHFHQRTLETHIVQEGWVAYVEQHPTQTTWTILRKGDIRTAPINVPHNIYLSAGAVLHTVKHGDVTSEPDWHASEDLDRITKCVPEDEIAGK